MDDVPLCRSILTNTTLLTLMAIWVISMLCCFAMPAITDTLTLSHFKQLIHSNECHLVCRLKTVVLQVHNDLFFDEHTFSFYRLDFYQQASDTGARRFIVKPFYRIHLRC